jgi:hypothetical protein
MEDLQVELGDPAGRWFHPKRLIGTAKRRRTSDFKTN